MKNVGEDLFHASFKSLAYLLFKTIYCTFWSFVKVCNSLNKAFKDHNTSAKQEK